MASGTNKKGECSSTEHDISEDIKNRYFPPGSNAEGYDVLPLYAMDDYNKRLMKSLSILENPSFAKKWQEYKAQLPYIARQATIVSFKNTTTTSVFVNCRKQKVPLDYEARFIAPPSSEAIFHNKSRKR